MSTTCLKQINNENLHAEFLNTCQTSRTFIGNHPSQNSLHVYSVSQCCSHPFSREDFFSAHPWCSASHPRGATHQESWARSNKCIRYNNFRGINKPGKFPIDTIKRRHRKASTKNLNKCDASTENRLRSPACRAKSQRPHCATIHFHFRHVQCCFSFLVYALGYIGYLVQFLLIPWRAVVTRHIYAAAIYTITIVR